MALTDKLTAIADAVRSKTGGTEGLTLDQMATEIAGISVGGGEELKITDARYLFYCGARSDQMDVFVSALSDECTSFEGMFAGNSVAQMPFVTVPFFDTSKGTSFAKMFYYCKPLISVPEYDMSNCETLEQTFSECSALAAVPHFDTSKVRTFRYTFAYCYALESIPKFNTSNGTNFYATFYHCSKLKSVPELDLNKGTSFADMFKGCTALTDLYLYNIRKSIQIGSGTSWGHLLTVDSLVHTIKELCTVTSSQTLTIGSANLEKISGLYCKITDAAHEKKTMELCESTDAGAMTLAEYALTKGWSIA